MAQINNTQKQLIHIGIQELGIDDDTYHLMLAGYGVDTSKDLQYNQASAFIDDLVRKGFRIKRRRRQKAVRSKQNSSNVVYLPTRQQLSMIEHLRADIIWRVDDGYFRLFQKMFGRTFLKSDVEAQKWIECLKNMKRNQMRRANQQSSIDNPQSGRRP